MWDLPEKFDDNPLANQMAQNDTFKTFQQPQSRDAIIEEEKKAAPYKNDASQGGWNFSEIQSEQQEP